MRKLLMIISLITTCSLLSNAQNSPSSGSDNKNKAPKTQQEIDDEIAKAELEPKPEIEGTWSKFLDKHINYDIALFNDAPRGVYEVKVQFTVFADGHIGNIIALTKHGYGMEKEVIKAIEKSPKWHPAFQNGKFGQLYRSWDKGVKKVIGKKKLLFFTFTLPYFFVVLFG